MTQGLKGVKVGGWEIEGWVLLWPTVQSALGPAAQGPTGLCRPPMWSPARLAHTSLCSFCCSPWLFVVETMEEQGHREPCGVCVLDFFSPHHGGRSGKLCHCKFRTCCYETWGGRQEVCLDQPVGHLHPQSASRHHPFTISFCWKKLVGTSNVQTCPAVPQ